MSTILAIVITSILGPCVLMLLTGHQRSKEKQEDWRREDIVAEKAAEAAKLLLAENKKVAASAKEASGKLDAIHILVNSNMTAAMEAQLVALQGQLVVMNRLAKIEDPTVNEQAAINAVEKQIAELTATVRDRLAATTKVEQAEVAEKAAAQGGE